MIPCRPRRALWCAFLAFVAAAPAAAQWSEGFESYADGSLLDGQGGWHGWDGVDTQHAVVASQFAASGAHALMLRAGSDSVHEFSGYDSGHWTLRAKVYTPSSFVGRAYFLVLNYYVDGGPYQWSVQVAFDGDQGVLEANCGAGTPTTLPLVLDQWVELRCDVDLDADLVDLSYDGAPVGSWPWSVGPFGGASYGLLQIDAVDLFSDAVGAPHTTELFLDDLELAPYQGVVGSAYCFGDGSGALCPCGNAGAADEGCANGTGAGAKLATFGSPVVPADDVVFHATQLPPGQPCLLFAGLNATNGGAGTVFGDGLRCAGGGVKRLGVSHANASGAASWGPGLGAQGGWLAGETRRFQAWYRDPAGSACGTAFNLSHGVEIVFVP
ncbi:MAG: hypothetical protein H6828_08850 [Planctomycetes bacterium]|nr:hypothetical protein [Planctomycetota bacterium]